MQSCLSKQAQYGALEAPESGVSYGEGGAPVSLSSTSVQPFAICKGNLYVIEKLGLKSLDLIMSDSCFFERDLTDFIETWKLFLVLQLQNEAVHGRMVWCHIALTVATWLAKPYGTIVAQSVALV